MTTIYLIRHAEAEGNLYRRIQGWYNALITDNGYRQIEALEERFRDVQIDAVYSSDLFRTMTTARAIYVPHHLALHVDPQLREIHLGDWENQTWGEITHFYPEEMARFNHFDPTWCAAHGESFRQVGDRMVSAITRIASSYPDQTVAIFSHGAAIRQALNQIKGVAPELWCTSQYGDNTAVSKLIFDDGKLTVEYEGDASHLTEEISTFARQSWWKKEKNGKLDFSLWFRPLDWEKDKDTYLAARKDRWTVHSSSFPFPEQEILETAQYRMARRPRSVLFAMSGDEQIGVLEVDPFRFRDEKAGLISFCYTIPEFRDLDPAVQLIGEAVTFFRPMGRDKLRVCCAPYDQSAIDFYTRFGFKKVGKLMDGPIDADLYELNIGFDH